jgi:hypothetical protein
MLLLWFRDTSYTDKRSGNVFTKQMAINRLHNPVLLLLLGTDHTENTCHMSDCDFIRALPSLGVAQMT